MWDTWIAIKEKMNTRDLEKTKLQKSETAAHTVVYLRRWVLGKFKKVCPFTKKDRPPVGPSARDVIFMFF
jgi:hypothetical protein